MVKFKADINTLKGCPLREKEIRCLLAEALQLGGGKENRRFSLSLAFVGPEEIRRLNRIYRKKNKVTDVLSFPEYPTAAALLREKKAEIFLGELIVCFSFVADSAKMNGQSVRRELAFVLVHGLLHLLGFRHGKKMFQFQDRAIGKIK